MIPRLPLKARSDKIMLLLFFLLYFLFPKMLELSFGLKIVLVLATKKQHEVLLIKFTELRVVPLHRQRRTLLHLLRLQNIILIILRLLFLFGWALTPIIRGRVLSFRVLLPVLFVALALRGVAVVYLWLLELYLVHHNSGQIIVVLACPIDLVPAMEVYLCLGVGRVAVLVGLILASLLLFPLFGSLVTLLLLFYDVFLQELVQSRFRELVHEILFKLIKCLKFTVLL